MFSKVTFLATLLAGGRLIAAQQVGTLQTETHPKLTWQKCTSSSCTSQSGEVVVDANWRWLHDVSSTTNCYTGNTWGTVCSTATDCATKCALEGADYSGTYGATTSGNALTLKFVTQTPYGKNIGSRMYLMNSATSYQTFTLTNNELAFDVDLSAVGCGLNAALYFVAMQSDGGMASYPTNKAGAKYGTGYCDSQCARDLKFVAGKANIEGWVPSSNDPNAGVGPYGACCAEIDVWESNSHSFALTPHACQNNNYHVCTTTGCGGTYSADRYAGDCDADGCDYNPYRVGNTGFYGAGKTLNTAQKFTVVTQFKANNLTQWFVQNGKKILIPQPTFSGFPSGSSITPDYCTAEKTVFGDRNRFAEVGGFTAVNSAMTLPMVLVMSIWDDHYANMLWLDSTYPVTKTTPGGPRGDCATSSGVPSDVEGSQPNAQVIWSNIRFGPIGSTVKI